MTKYLKSYTAITSGTMGGRDDGYPYTAYQVLNDIEAVANSYGERVEEQYFEIHAVNDDEFKREVELVKEKIVNQKIENERAKKMKKLKELQEELGVDY